VSLGIVSPQFLAVTLGAALAIRFLGTRVPRCTIVLVASVAFIFAIAGSVVLTLPFWVLVLGGFLVVRYAPHAESPVAMVALAALVVLAWWLLRMVATADSAPASGTVPASVAALGLSYAMFRIIHMAVDARDDALGGKPSLQSYLCYLTFFPNYLAGPVQRFQHFSPQLDAPAAPADRQSWLMAGKRAIRGTFKCTALAGAALALHRMSVGAIDVVAAGGAADAMNALLLAPPTLAYTAYLLFSFAGYMDIAIGAGLVLGIVVPENFDQPQRARNFLDLWSRWHITLSDWFRFYVFNPLLKLLLGAIDRPRLVPYLGAFGYFVAFFLMGLWHGRTPALIVYGLVLGAGVSVNKLFQLWQVKSLGRRGYTARCERPAYQVFAQALALAYFVMALCLLWQPPLDRADRALPILLGATLLVLAACALLAVANRWLRMPSGSSAAVAPAILAAQALAATGYLWWLHGAVPELIYQWL
jgi:alginate O-acetyltransferase complex protein AlgI